MVSMKEMHIQGCVSHFYGPDPIEKELSPYVLYKDVSTPCSFFQLVMTHHQL